MKTRALTATALGALALTGCVNLAPAYEPGALPVPASLPVEAPDATAVEPLRWEDVVTSPALQ